MDVRYPLSYSIPGVYRKHLNNNKDIDLVEHLCKKNLIRGIPDVNEFLKNIALVKEQPYVRTLYGESERECIALRSAVADYAKFADANKKYSFAAWTLWQQRKDKVYLGSNIIYAFCGSHKLDAKEFMRFLHTHPEKKNFYTYVELFFHENNIQKWIQKAAWLGFAGKDSPKLDSVQNDALKKVIKSSFSCVQGGAGVGKTTTVSEIIKQVKNMTVVQTVTFTHKAKRCVEKRLSMAGIDGVNTSTIHSFVFQLKSTKFPRLFLIVDESSMVDLELMGELAKMMMENCESYQLCFVGDKMQLPSVGRGEIYRMMVDSNGGHVNSLVKCYRTDKPDLFEAYENIRNGRIPKSTDNFEVHLYDTDKEIDSFVGNFINEHEANYMYVAWQNKDVLKVNKWVQAAMLKAGKIGPLGWNNLYMHDRVVYRGENKDALTNAMTGTVTSVEADGMTVTWDDSTEVTAFKKDSYGIQLMYCGTCHILQGSEYDKVCVLCYDIPKMIKCSDRKWIYTAVTRAQNKVVFVSTHDVQIFIEHPIADVPLSSLKF